MINKTISLPDQDLGLFLELIKRFNWTDNSTESNVEIPEWHKAETLKRLNNSTPKNLLNWDEVKNNFIIE